MQSSIKKILLIKTSSLGDILHTFPAIDYLRQRFPTGRIDWVVEKRCAELLYAHPQVDRVIPIDSKQWKRHLLPSTQEESLWALRRELRSVEYDILFDLQGNTKSGIITGLAQAKRKVGLSWRDLSEWPSGLTTREKISLPEGLNVREEYLYLIQTFFGDQRPYLPSSISLRVTEEERAVLERWQVKEKRPTLVCPGAAWENKRLSTEQLIALLHRLHSFPYWFIWGNALEKEMVTAVAAHFPGSVVLDRCSLPLLQHVMAASSLVIAVDSLALHLCGTTDTLTLSLFGPSLASKFAPLGASHRALQGTCPYGFVFSRRCPRLRTCATGACMRRLKVVDPVE